MDDELSFLASYDASRYARPSLAVDVVLLTVRDDAVWCLLRRRVDHPDKGQWALPGGFVGIDESLDSAAARVLEDKVGLAGTFIEQLYTFGELERDPRTRVVSVAYYALVDPASLEAAVARLNDDRRGLARLVAPWPSAFTNPPPAVARDEDGRTLQLAFDHAVILGAALARIRGKLDYAPIGFELLPEVFSLRDLRLVHEAIVGRQLNKDSFRRRILERGLVVPTEERQAGVGHRPPLLYRFAAPRNGETLDDA